MRVENRYSFNDISDCVHCGKCKASCPTYIENPTEIMGARGRVALLRKFNEGEITATKRLYDSVFSCILCEACNKSCPLGIRISDAVYIGRKSLRNYDKKRLLVNHLIKLAFKNPFITFKLLKILKIISSLPRAENLYLIGHLKRLGITIPDSQFRGKTSVFRARNPRGRLAIFSGCVVNGIYPYYGRSLVNILNSLRYDVIIPPGEVCCGAPLLELGSEKDAARMAEINIEAFKNLNVEAVISLCPTCVHFIKNIYKRQIGDCIDNALDISQFLTGRFSGMPELSKDRLTENPAASFINPGSNCIYHDPCHSKFGLNIYEEPRNILKMLGLNLIEPDESGCCGFGGTFRLFYEDLSEGILQNRLESYKKADMIITSCPNCILQLKSRLKDRNVIHIIDIIAGVIKKNDV